MEEVPDARPPIWTGHLVVNTADLGTAVHFYEQLGMRLVGAFETFAALEMRGGTHLAIRLDPAQVAPGPASWDLMVDDLDAIHDQWQASGVPVSDVVVESPHRVFEITDPDGHVVAVRDSHVAGPV